MRKMLAIGAALALGTCATVTRGTTEQITFNSDPPEAKAVLSDGHSCPSTPCTFAVDRKSEFIAVFTKDGYQRQEIPVSTRIASSGAAGFAGNLLIGGVIGMGVDASTGATLEHYPNPVFATMQPSEVVTPSKPEAKSRKRIPPKPVPQS